jgi:Phosphoadenosine phosphosulfate reductase family
MRKVVSFSGGRTSAYLCKIMLDTFGRENVDFIFMDTGAEHPKTYEFIRQVNQHFGLNLVCLRGDFNQPLGVGHSYSVVDIATLCFDLGVYTELVSKYGTPGIANPWCTSRMKEEVHDKYCNDIYGKNGYETWIGIRADEPKRLKIGKRCDVRYLAEISNAEKVDVINFWRSMHFDLEIDEWLGNCVFCFKKSDLKLALACKDSSQLYDHWSKMIDSSPERVGQERASRHVMYRKNRTLADIKDSFSDVPRENIIARLRGGRMLDAGSCSESCEAFSSET